MDFQISDEQQALVESAHKFAVHKLAPGYRAGDKSGRVDRAMVKAMGDMGFLGPELPEAYGGMGVDCVTSGLLSRLPTATSTCHTSTCSPRCAVRSLALTRRSI